MSPTNVLIVDDSKLIVKLLKKALLENQIDGFLFDEAHIFTAYDGIDALDNYSLNPQISMIISDVNMPNLSGNELIDILHDTNKLSKVQVILITTQGSSDKLSKDTKEKILGIINKPFTNESFAQRFNQLLQTQSNKAMQETLLKKDLQDQAKRALQLIKKYLKDEAIDFDLDRLQKLTQEYFTSESAIEADEFSSLIYSILTDIYDELMIGIPINDQAIKHLITPQRQFTQRNPFELEEKFNDTMLLLDPSTLQEEEVDDTLMQLFVEFSADIAAVFKSVAYIPAKEYDLFYPYFSYVIKELRLMDRTFYNYELQKAIAEYDELVKMKKHLEKVMVDEHLQSLFPALVLNSYLHEAMRQQFTSLLRLLNTTIGHYTAWIDLRIWSSAKSSTIILSLLSKALPAMPLNTKNFLVRRKKITPALAKQFDPYYKEVVMVISGDVEEQNTLKLIQGKYFLNWDFVAFSKISLMELWLKKNRPTKIIIDYNFKTSDSSNGINFLLHIQKRFPPLQTAFKLDEIYIMHNKNVSTKIELEYEALSFSHLIKPLDIKQVAKTFLYH